MEKGEEYFRLGNGRSTFAYQIQSLNEQRGSYSQETLHTLTNVHSRNRPCNPGDRPLSVQKILAYTYKKHGHTYWVRHENWSTFSSRLTVTAFNLAINQSINIVYSGQASNSGA